LFVPLEKKTNIPGVPRAVESCWFNWSSVFRGLRSHCCFSV